MSTSWTQTQQAGKKEKRFKFEARKPTLISAFFHLLNEARNLLEMHIRLHVNIGSLQVMSKHDMSDS